MTEDELARTATAPSTDGGPPVAVVGAGRLGKYELAGKLGEGGMGVVHAAFDPDLERRVAIKLLRNAGDASSRARLLREARAMARLAHPNVVAVYEVGTIDGRDFVAMELFEGESLAEWLRASPRGTRDILDAFTAAGRGLAAAHAAGLVHRDFKPHNVLRARGSGRIAVTDFGLARAVDASLATAVAAAGAVDGGGMATPLMTSTGAVLGTPAYMSPEQWDGHEVGPTTDQFAFCVALWEALAGERPFSGATGEELREAIAKGAPDAARVPRRFRALLRRGLDPDPARRFTSLDALLAALEAARRRRVLPWLAVLVPAAVIGVLIAQVERSGPPPSPSSSSSPSISIVPPMPPEPPAPPAPPEIPSPTPPTPPAPPEIHQPTPIQVVTDPLLATIRKDDDTENEYIVPRTTRDALVAHGLEQYASSGRLVPTVNRNKPGGYKLYAMTADGIFPRFGLRNGDTLRALDNIVLSPENLDQLRQALTSDDDHVLDIVRGTTAIRIAISIE